MSERSEQKPLSNAPGLQFQSTGPEANEGIQDLAELFRRDFPEWQVHQEGATLVPGERKADTVAVLSLIVMIPPAIMASWDLARRVELKKRVVDPLIAWAKNRRQSGKTNPVVMLSPDEEAVPLDEVRPDEVLNAVDAAIKESKS